MNSALKQNFINKLISIVSLFVIGYVVFYFYLGAFLSMALLAISGLILLPCVYFLNRKNYLKPARYLFLISCLIFVITTPLGIAQDLTAEYYFVPAILLACTLFEARQKKEIIFAATIPVLAWIFIQFDWHLGLAKFNILNSEMIYFLRALNFIGASVVTGVFVRIYVAYSEQIQASMRDDVEALNKDLAEAIAKAIAKASTSEKELQTLFDNLPVGITIQNENNEFTRMNPAAPQILGLTPDQMKGHSSSTPKWQTLKQDKTVLPFDEHPSVVCSRTAKACFNKIIGIQRPSGDLRWLSVTAIPLFKNLDESKRDVIVLFTDISEIYEKNLIIEQNERFLKNILKAIPFNISYINKDYTYKFVNESYTNFFKISTDDIVGKKISDVIGAAAFEKIKPLADKAFAGEDQNFEIKLQLPILGERLLQTNYIADRAKSGQIEGFYVVANDITDSRTQELQLRQTLAAINESAIVAITDKSGKILEVNDLFCQVSGYSKDELVGQNHRILKSGVHSDEFFKNLWRTISSGKVWTGELQNLTKLGKAYHVQTVISPLYNLQHQIERYIAIRFDVSLMREAEKLFEEAQMVARVGSWSYDAVEREFTWSKQMYEIFLEDKKLGQPNLERHISSIHPDDQLLWREKFEATLNQDAEFKLRFRRIIENKTIWVEAIAKAKKDTTGKITSVSGTCQEITYLVLAEENAKIERAKSQHNSKLASLGELAAGVAHEINNPLAIISGASSLIYKFQNEPLKLEAKVTAIQKATERIVRIVNNLRKFSRTSNNPDYKPHSLKKIIDESIEMTEIKSHRHAIPIEFESAIQGAVVCDELEIEQVIVNLISNSIDAIKNLADKWIKISLTEENAKIVLKITDSGKGIAPQIAEKLFDPFFTTKPVGEGTGLGLSIVKGILDGHGATIQLLENEINTCFEIKFEKQER